MNKAYIILVHRQPEQLTRLIDALDDGASTFYVHIDKKTPVHVFEKILPRVTLIEPREDGNWGEFGIVQATLNAFKQVIEHQKNFDFISLLSGQDYPIKSNRDIDNFLANNKEKIFTAFLPFPIATWSGGGGFGRLNIYHYGNRLNPTFIQKWTGRAINFLPNRIKFLRRTPPKYIPNFYGSSQWFTLPTHAVRYILDFVSQHPTFVTFNKYSLLPDEFFFQTILCNSSDPNIQHNLVNNNLRYIDWSGRKNQSPAIFGKEDLNELLTTDALFARKFDENYDLEIFDLIDKFRAENE